MEYEKSMKEKGLLQQEFDNYQSQLYTQRFSKLSPEKVMEYKNEFQNSL